MAFKKWTSIENHYQNKFIDHFMQRYGGELKHETFVITEKVDGANFSVIFYPDGHCEFAKRSGLVDDGFYDYKSAFQTDEMEKFIARVSAFCIFNKRTIQFVGELFGQGVQKRVYYGPDKYWAWYAIYEHLKDETVKNFNIIEIGELQGLIMKQNNLNINDCMAKGFYAVVGLEKALEFDIMKNSLYTPEDYNKENLMEGAVIRPLNNYHLGVPGDSSMLIIKKKNPDFDDKNRVKKERKTFNVSENLQSLYDKTIGYVNENRTADLFSKFGKIDAITEMGKYLGFYSKDVHSDIVKDYPLDFDNLEKTEQKWLMKQFISAIKEELRKEL